MIRISDMKHQNKGETSKRSSNKTPTIDIDMVNFLPSHFLANINQPNNLMGDVFAKEVEWVKFFEEVVNEFVIM